MHDWKRAFGKPNAAFEQRVQRTLRQIQEKEEAKVKKKLTLSVVLACALCLTVLTLSALAAADLLGSMKPDVTLSPLQEGDAPSDSPIVFASPTPTTDSPTVFASPTPTPMPMGYYYVGGHALYHVDFDCSLLHGKEVGIISNDDAASLGIVACPYCSASLSYYTREDDPFYHVDESCHTETAADPSDDLLSVSWKDAVSMNKTPCPVCIGSSVYCTLAGLFYHAEENCQGIENTDEMPLYLAASVLLKEPCPICAQTVSDSTSDHVSDDKHITPSAAESDPTESNETTARADDKSLYCYIENALALYHMSENCADIQGVVAPALWTDVVSTEDGVQYSACANCTVFAAKGGVFYHMDPDCSGMTNAFPATKAYMESLGKQLCPECLSASTLA